MKMTATLTFKPVSKGGVGSGRRPEGGAGATAADAPGYASSVRTQMAKFVEAKRNLDASSQRVAQAREAHLNASALDKVKTQQLLRTALAEHQAHSDYARYTESKIKALLPSQMTVSKPLMTGGRFAVARSKDTPDDITMDPMDEVLATSIERMLGGESVSELKLDLGSGQNREPGFIGFDLYPYDPQTIVWDLNQGLPMVPDGSVAEIRMLYVWSLIDPLARDKLSSEIARVLTQGGVFNYEDNMPFGPQDPFLYLDQQEDNEQDVEDNGVTPIYRQSFSRVEIPIEEPDFEKDMVRISKADTKKQIVYGVVLAPDEVDTHGDYMTSDDIEKAAHRFMRSSRVIASEHSQKIDAHPVESFIAPKDDTFDGPYGRETIKKGSWIMGVKIEDKAEWERVMNGDYTGFSIGGFGIRD